MEFAVLASGSGGNATVIRSKQQSIMVDAGLSLGKLSRRLLNLGIDPDSITDLVLTHGHIDHVRGARLGQIEHGWRIWATKGCVAMHKPLQRLNIQTFTPGQVLDLGGFLVETVKLAHDAPDTVGVKVTDQNTLARLAIVTDLGEMDAAVEKLIANVEALIIEMNHDPYKLAKGSYPPALKARVAGVTGHLSNAQGIAACVGIMHEFLQWVILAHLSEENNDATLALNSFKKAVAKTSWTGQVRVAWPDRAIGLFEVLGPGHSRGFMAEGLFKG